LSIGIPFNNNRQHHINNWLGEMKNIFWNCKKYYLGHWTVSILNNYIPVLKTCAGNQRKFKRKLNCCIIFAGLLTKIERL